MKPTTELMKEENQKLLYAIFDATKQRNHLVVLGELKEEKTKKWELHRDELYRVLWKEFDTQKNGVRLLLTWEIDEKREGTKKEYKTIGNNIIKELMRMLTGELNKSEIFISYDNDKTAKIKNCTFDDLSKFLMDMFKIKLTYDYEGEPGGGYQYIMSY